MKCTHRLGSGDLCKNSVNKGKILCRMHANLELDEHSKMLRGGFGIFNEMVQDVDPVVSKGEILDSAEKVQSRPISLVSAWKCWACGYDRNTGVKCSSCSHSQPQKGTEHA